MCLFFTRLHSLSVYHCIRGNKSSDKLLLCRPTVGNGITKRKAVFYLFMHAWIYCYRKVKWMERDVSLLFVTLSDNFFTRAYFTMFFLHPFSVNMTWMLFARVVYHYTAIFLDEGNLFRQIAIVVCSICSMVIYWYFRLCLVDESMKEPGKLFGSCRHFHNIH